MAGWEKIMTAETAPTRIDKQSGASQLETLKRLVLTSSNTSPGTAKMFSNRAANEVLESLGSWGGDCWVGGGSSIVRKSGSRPFKGSKTSMEEWLAIVPRENGPRVFACHLLSKPADCKGLLFAF